MRTTRRRLLQLVVATAAAGAATAADHAAAQAWPTRHVTLLVPVGPGGAPDIFARLLGDQLASRLGQPMVIENRPGVGGNLALQAVARAPADGHMLLLMTTPHAINTTLYPDLTASLTRDIAPVIGLTGDGFVVVVTPSLPLGSLGELIGYARANPGKLNMASSGTGNLSHLSGELFKMMAKVDMVHVPYRSTPAALSDVMSGNVHVMFDSIASARPSIDGGSLRGLAVTSSERHPLLPRLPPIADLVPGYEMNGWMGIGVPKATPADIIERLAREISAVVNDPVIKARLADAGSAKGELTAAAFGKLIAHDTGKWAEVIRYAGLKAR